MALPTNWVDDIGMIEDAAFLNQVGTEVNALTTAVAALPRAAAKYVATGENTTSATYVDLTTTTDTISLNIGASKIARIDIMAGLNTASVTSTFLYVGFTLSGANTLAASDALALQLSNNDGILGPVRSASFILTPDILTATGVTTVKLKYRATGGTMGAYKRFLSGFVYA